MPKGVYKHKKASLETRLKMSRVRINKPAPWNLGNKHAWKETVSYAGIHKWIDGALTRPDNCENCGKRTNRIEWANISGDYRRDVSDWAALCKICHCLFDDSYRSKILPDYISKFLGQKQYRLTAIAYVGKSIWTFKCDCGNTKAIRKAHVNAGKIKSCGCFQKEFMKGVAI